MWVPADGNHPTGSATMMRINAVKTSLRDMSKCRIARASYKYQPSSSSSDERICHKHDEKPKPGGKTILLMLDTIWHPLKQQRQKFWIWKALDRGSRQLPVLVHGHRDQAASHQMVQRSPQWDVEQHRIPSLPAVPAPWTIGAQIDDYLENLGNRTSHQGAVYRARIYGHPDTYLSRLG